MRYNIPKLVGPQRFPTDSELEELASKLDIDLNQLSQWYRICGQIRRLMFYVGYPENFKQNLALIDKEKTMLAEYFKMAVVVNLMRMMGFPANTLPSLQETPDIQTSFDQVLGILGLDADDISTYHMYKNDINLLQISIEQVIYSLDSLRELELFVETDYKKIPYYVAIMTKGVPVILSELLTLGARLPVSEFIALFEEKFGIVSLIRTEEDELLATIPPIVIEKLKAGILENDDKIALIGDDIVNQGIALGTVINGILDGVQPKDVEAFLAKIEIRTKNELYVFESEFYGTYTWKSIQNPREKIMLKLKYGRES